MAMAAIRPLLSFCSLLPSNRLSSRQPIYASLNPSAASLNANKRRSYNQRLQQLPRISSEGVPSELIEDPKFVPLNVDDPVYGPPALLLLGFEADETNKIKEFLKGLDGDFLKVVHCTENMLTQSVWEAMHTEQPRLEAVQIAKSLPRLCFMSGLSGEEMMMLIDAFPDTGLKPAVFAALVPNSADKILGDVMEEIMGDHEMMSAKNSS